MTGSRVAATGRRRALALAAFAALTAASALVAGCGAHGRTEPAAHALTEAQRDTVIARSQLPGAAVVQRALDLNGHEAVRATQLDTLPK